MCKVVSYGKPRSMGQLLLEFRDKQARRFLRVGKLSGYSMYCSTIRARCNWKILVIKSVGE